MRLPPFPTLGFIFSEFHIQLKRKKWIMWTIFMICKLVSHYFELTFYVTIECSFSIVFFVDIGEWTYDMVLIR